jgi:hypothetical protein
MMAEPLFVLAGDTDPSLAGLRGKHLRTADEVRSAFVGARRACWIASRSMLRLLREGASETHDTWHRLVTADELDTPRRELLGALFRVVVAPGGGTKVLPLDEIKEVLTADHPEDYFIGGVVDVEDRAVVLYRGNLERLVVPLAWFKHGRRSPKPAFDDFEVIDGGQTIRFGDYEAATDAILYDFDRASRQRMKQREIDGDQTFGGALRRLRLHRGLSRADFEPLSDKTIARIERGEVGKPHGDTLAMIAKKLGVEPDDIESH